MSETSLAQKIWEMRSDLLKDPLFNLLRASSNLTQRQVETLLLDVLAEQEEVRLTSEQKASLRSVSKGSFIRTRKQAQRNLSRALFTTILAAYLGMLKLPSFHWFLDVGELMRQRDAESLRDVLDILRQETGVEPGNG